MATKYRYLFCSFLLIILAGCSKKSEKEVIVPEEPADSTEDLSTFTNPLMTGADPWVAQKDGTYYCTHTTGSGIVVYPVKKLSELGKASPVTLWKPPSGTAYSSNLWAPELHEINGKWYTYFAADNGNDANHRMYVLENTSDSPLRGNWVFKGKVADPTNEWAIDGTILEYNGLIYMLWSGKNSSQNIYIAKLSNPWTIEGQRVMISTPVYSWEKYGGPINEGPEILKNPDGAVFLIYSGSGFWVDNYCLGMLRLKDGGDPMVASDWIKSPVPVFSQNAESGAYGPGHNGFFKSPDNKEDWIIYHARSLPDGGDTNHRNLRIQKFTWNADGTPNLGVPVKIGEKIKKPSGE